MSEVSIPTFKIVSLGTSGVGKSSIIQRLVNGTFTQQGTTTCGADFYCYTTEVNGQQVKLQIWDTAGQEKFRAISKAYFRNALGAILVFDITSPISFEELGRWLNDVQLLAVPNAYILLIANKMDLEQHREVGAAQVKAFAETHQLTFVETSACSGLNVEMAFKRLTDEVYVRVKTGQIQTGPAPTGHTQQLAPPPSALTPADPKSPCC
jgi:small GTP-binding protein